MTFSVAARCPKTGMLGVAITTSSIAVASRCPWARAGVGAVSTQNITDPSLGRKGLDLLQSGLAAPEAMKQLMLGTDYAGNQTMVAREEVTPSLVAQHWFAKNAYVKLNAGSTYGLGGENYMRINCATARSTLKAGLDSMANALKKISA